MMKKKFVHYIFLFLCICVVWHTSVIEAEAVTLFDKEKEAAKTLDMGKNYLIQWEKKSTAELNKFTVDKNGVFTVKVEKPWDTSGYRSHYVQIFNESGQELLTFINTDSKVKDAYYNIGLKAGTYYVKNWMSGQPVIGTEYSYICTFSATDCAEVERNDTKETATVMGLDTEYAGYFGGTVVATGFERDIYDVYKVSLKKGCKYIMTNTSADLICMLFTNDKALDSSSGVGCNVTYVAPYTGDYYIVVYSSNKSKPQTAYKVMVKSVGSEPQKDPVSNPDKETDPDVAEDGEINYNPQISPKTPKIKSVKSSKKKITIKWKKVSGNGYIIQYGTKKSFKGAKKKVVTSGKKTKLTIKNLKKGKKYYVRIRAYKVQQGTKYYSKWSGKKSIKVK